MWHKVKISAETYKRLLKILLGKGMNPLALTTFMETFKPVHKGIYNVILSDIISMLLDEAEKAGF